MTYPRGQVVVWLGMESTTIPTVFILTYIFSYLLINYNNYNYNCVNFCYSKKLFIFFS